MRIWQRWVYVVVLLSMPVSAWAQAWPSKQPVRVIVPFTPGSATDTIARVVFEQVGRQVGQSFVVDNRPGAGGTIGAAAVAKADPDGYTLLLNSSSHTMTPALYSNLPYDTARDLRAVIPLANTPMLLIVVPTKYKTVADLVKAAKDKPGSINYASAGPGTAAHINTERFRLAAGFEAVHVPMRGAPEALREVLAERVDFYFSPLPPAQGLINEGKLAAIAVSSSRRALAMPNVPTTLEAGYKNSEYNFWAGLFAPGGTPRDIIQRLYQETAKALDEPAVKERLARAGGDPMKLTTDQFEALIKDELKTNAELVKAAGMKVN